jgi:amylosucrase
VLFNRAMSQGAHDARPTTEAMASLLEGLDDADRETIELRLERWCDDLVAALRVLYPDRDVSALTLRLVERAVAAHRVRSPELRRLDQRRLLRPDWLQQPGMFGYACYTDRFAGDLEGLRGRIDYLRDLGVTYLHLMPLLQPREGDNDGGYAVQDYRTVRADLGDVDDLVRLASDLRGQGISLVLDLVLNHVAREHEWAERARAGESRYRDYFHVFPDRVMPDAYERTLPEVFPDFAPGNFTWDDELEAWVWTTFNDYQWDLNWANPSVLCEFADILLGHANLGVEVFRLDAIAFLWKRMGTNCQNQPEVHHLTQALRTVARIAAPAVLFKAEAIVGPADLPAYLGTGAHAGKVSDLAYHNSLMVQVWSMLASGEVGLAALALQNLPQPPPTTSWITYLRCHDDIGWAIDDTDAWRAGLNGHAHRRFLADWYAGSFPGSWARGLVFQENHQTGDRRISGSLASLAGRQADDPAATARILLAHSVILSFGGLPVIWMGDEVGLLNDLGWADDPAHAADNRWAHRPRMPWPVPEDTDGIREGLDHLLHVRASLPHLHAASPTEVWDPRDPGVLLVVRRSPHGPLLAAANMTDRAAHVPSEVFYWLGMAGGELVDHLTGDRPRFDGDSIALGPYAAAWLTAEHGNT